MKTITMPSMRGLPNAPMLAVRVEKPPVATVENEWQMASKDPMPASRSARYSIKVRAT